jgi:UPF0271 protein
MLLGVDAGELPGEPEDLWLACDWIHVACGGHAGDAASMARVAAACAGRVQLGAHPSYPDRGGFGRTPIAMAPRELAASVAEQCRALAAHARIAHAKPHGALYHDADRSPELAAAFVDGVVAAAGAVAIVGPPAGCLREAAEARGLRYLREGFADRGLRADGSLIPRGEAGALILDPAVAAAQAALLADGAGVDILCVHGDSPGALGIAHAVRAAIG